MSSNQKESYKNSSKRQLQLLHLLTSFVFNPQVSTCWFLSWRHFQVNRRAPHHWDPPRMNNAGPNFGCWLHDPYKQGEILMPSMTIIQDRRDITSSGCEDPTIAPSLPISTIHQTSSSTLPSSWLHLGTVFQLPGHPAATSPKSKTAVGATAAALVAESRVAGARRSCRNRASLGWFNS